MTQDDLLLSCKHIEHDNYPHGVMFYMGASVGRFCSAVICAVIPGDDTVLVVAEEPNYHYVGDGEIEELGLTTTQWAEKVVARWRDFVPKRPAIAFVNEDNKFEKALKRSKLVIRKNLRRPAATRTEISREFFDMKLVRLMPWLNVLPYELQNAKWPPEASGRGSERVEGQDYTLSGLEHVLSRRPRPRKPRQKAQSTFLQKQLAKHQITLRGRGGDVHLGGQ